MHMNNNTNIMFSDLSLRDKQDLLFNLKNYILTYRNILSLDTNITFGVEIEFENCSMLDVKHIFNEYNIDNWIVKKEPSIISGGEINSPILRDSINTWNDLKKVCNILKESGARITENCGGHIHIGSNILGNDINNWMNFIKVIIAFEKILFRFGYGENNKERHAIRKYAYPISYLLKELLILSNTDFNNMTTNEFLELIKSKVSKRSAVNFNKVHINTLHYPKNNTIEFRFPNGTIEEVIWQNNINTFTKVLLAIKNNKIDMDLVSYYMDEVKQVNNTNLLLKSYNDIYLDTALIFVDMIFDNYLDKLYFLRQYLKDFNCDFSYSYSKKFI